MRATSADLNGDSRTHESATSVHDGSAPRASGYDLGQVTLVDDETLAEAAPTDPSAGADEELLELERSGRSPAHPGDAIANLTLSEPNLRRAHEVCAEFDAAEDLSVVGEKVLCELVGGEVAVAMQLRDIEAAMAALLSKTITDPEMTVAVCKGLKETIGLSTAIRRRMENSLSAAASLKAQRILLTAQRGQDRGD